MKALVVWFDQARVGELHLDDSGRLSFGYDGAFVGKTFHPPVPVCIFPNSLVHEARSAIFELAKQRINGVR